MKWAQLVTAPQQFIQVLLHNYPIATRFTTVSAQLQVKKPQDYRQSETLHLELVYSHSVNHMPLLQHIEKNASTTLLLSLQFCFSKLTAGCCVRLHFLYQHTQTHHCIIRYPRWDDSLRLCMWTLASCWPRGLGTLFCMQQLKRDSTDCIYCYRQVSGVNQINLVVLHLYINNGILIIWKSCTYEKRSQTGAL